MEESARGDTILIIDDEEPIRDGCRQTLEKSGYAVLTAGDGPEGVRVARLSKPQLVFVDLKMPGMSGMEIIEILAKDIPDVVLIVITGYASIVSAVEAMHKGAYDYLPKPFSPDQLRAVAKRGMEHRSLKIEARLLREEKERMEKSFITFVSHEMRSPLVTVQQYMESLRALAGPRLEQAFLDILDRCSERIRCLAEMIERWLDLSRIETGLLATDKKPLRLTDVIRRSVEEMAPACERAQIGIETEAAGPEPPLCGDEESLVRVFTNLIGNAVKYTPAGGRISVRSVFDDHYIRASVSDTGSGIPADKLPFIFEPFYRVRGKAEKTKGSGLGLTFCRKIVSAHGGTIEARSDEGKGTTFLLKFPRS
ncbi:MAG: Alkaline phosphatase synthesis sensor protein PhoR [Syntrophaceae bacterium PtaU1.Bin231]|nr:MAG: Alkaline phosphatase synthesis sensor protein PhoR [Syntrophaceae bacterium PtaU1.Bin231]HOG18655.1 ATP-binding protein [Syntrophales bacterium]